MRIRSLAAVCLALVSSACGSGDDAAPQIQRTPPASLLVRCAGPVEIPARDLTGAEVEVMWGRDRSALRSCGSQAEALVGWMVSK